MLNQAVQDAINEQIKKEFYSAYLYLSMAAYSESINLPGFAHWMKTQAQEEQTHAMKFFEYVHDRGGHVTLGAIDAPPTEFKAPFDMFQQVLEHERQVTASINNLYEIAVKQTDYPTQALLQWFITEQVEEEKNATALVEQLRMVGNMSGILLMIDGHLARRNIA